MKDGGSGANAAEKCGNEVRQESERGEVAAAPDTYPREWKREAANGGLQGGLLGD